METLKRHENLFGEQLDNLFEIERKQKRHYHNFT